MTTTMTSELRHQTSELKVVTECRLLYFMVYDQVKDRKDYYLWNHALKSIISIGSNLAEGNKRGKKEQIQFILISKGSIAEFEFQYSLLNIKSEEIPLQIDKIKAMTHGLWSAVRGQMSK